METTEKRKLRKKGNYGKKENTGKKGGGVDLEVEVLPLASGNLLGLLLTLTRSLDRDTQQGADVFKSAQVVSDKSQNRLLDKIRGTILGGLLDVDLDVVSQLGLAWLNAVVRLDAENTLNGVHRRA
jgi:hypothetical protein